MSANLLAGVKPTLMRGTTEDGGTYHHAARTGADGHNDWLIWDLAGQSALATNQTYHVGLSVRGASADADSLRPTIGYMDAAGHRNWAATAPLAVGTSWTRAEATIAIPSGMTPFAFYVSVYGKCPEMWMAAATLSCGSPVTLASSAHTPYATQDHVSVTYATKASLKVTDDSVKAEVSARAQTDRNVADLSSRLTQTANSLTSEISDRRTAITTVTGLANAAQSTADGAAKQANLYTIGNGDAGAVPKWIHLGTLTSAGDASSATIAIVFGDGYNGGARQNSTLTITIKDGYQGTQSATGACGVTAMRENCDAALVDVLAQSATVYDLWVYAPWDYSNGRYSISGHYVAWKHSGATQKAEPATSATQVKQDVAYRLADATKAQTMATENQSSIKQLSDSITSEVSARTELSGRVGTLESTTGTHTSRLEQLATSIKSLIKGESTYTDPDGNSATSGIYSLVTQTREAVTALFGSYTKTADLASTAAVRDAKKAGTDAQAAASAAQSTADSASSTAGAAKSTADSLATMIREDATGITVGKSADGKTYTTGRTRMTDSAFEVLDKAGKVLASFGGKVISLMGGLLTITAGHNGGGEIYPASGKDFLLKSGNDAEVSGNHGSYIEINDDFTSLNSEPAGGEMNSLTVGNNGIVAQTQGVSGLMLCPVHSIYNKYNGVHIYTGEASEISSLASSGWTDEGVKFYAFLDPSNR